jgi:hypothetical protein
MIFSQWVHPHLGAKVDFRHLSMDAAREHSVLVSLIQHPDAD